ncbi:unnamed protein product [Fraxinus pennsylvanica]|uniref:EF-hand domain-containing protein n=1 Tax=Fraxinus pennsylvanica TaxID=56036 RepID=A0AAD1ZS58_9LAMI|nr:unnamed protein product [Fraxinus pennsylvanica]
MQLHGHSLNVSGPSSIANAAANNFLPSVFLSVNKQPLSPESPSGSPSVKKQKADLPALGSPKKLVNDPGKELTPQDDFKPVLGELLASHPGLQFLQSTSQFQDRYASTLISAARLSQSPIPPLHYWFKCLDFDANGVITRNEMQYFYNDLQHRMEDLHKKAVPFEDILCQIVDMINPPVIIH